MKTSEIRELNRKELSSKILDLKQEMFNLRFQQATNKLKNPMRIREIRKDIAKIKTILREQELNIKR